MKISRPILLFFFCSVFINCTKDETPTPKSDTEEQSMPEPKPEEANEPEDEVYFSYYVNPNEHLNGWTDSWVIIHNQDGELLDYKLFKSNDSLDFVGSADKLKTTNTLSITTLNYKPSNDGGDFHIMSTATGISKSTIWDWSDEYEPYLPNPASGNQFQLSIKVNNVPNVERYELASQFDGYLAVNQNYQETNNLDIWNIFFQQDRQYLLNVRDGNDDLKYLFFELIDPSENITLDYNDFLEYDHIIEVDLPEHENYQANVYGKNKSENYLSDLKISGESSGRQIRTTAKIGYMNAYDTFITQFFFDYNENVRYSFYRDGEMPTGINVPLEPQFQSEQTNIYNYSFTTDVTYYQNRSFWVYQDLEQDNYTRYAIIGKSEGAPIIGILPSEILEKYPSLNLDNLKYEATSLYIGENIEFKSDNRTSGGLSVPRGFENLIFKSTEE